MSANAELIARANRDRHCIYIAVQERISRRGGDSDDVCAIFTDCLNAIAAAEIEIERLTKELGLGSRKNSAMSNNELIARLELAKRETAEVIGEAQTALAAAEARVKKLERLNSIYARFEHDRLAET